MGNRLELCTGGGWCCGRWEVEGGEEEWSGLDLVMALLE